MAVTPDVVYNNTISPGGIDYPITENGRRREFGGIWHITPEMLRDFNFNKTDHYDQDHYLMLWMPYINGSIQVRMWVEDVTIPASPDPIVLTDYVHVDVYASKKESGCKINVSGKTACYPGWLWGKQTTLTSAYSFTVESDTARLETEPKYLVKIALDALASSGI